LADTTTDERLLTRAGGGDEEAFLELYQRHRLPVFRFAYRLLGSVESAEDVTHDCFLSLIRSPGNFQSRRASLRTYLFAAARNLAFKHFRKVGRETTLRDLHEDPGIGEREQPLARLLDEELTAHIRDAVVNLPPLQREALVLFEYEGLAMSEIASIVGADIGAVKARLYRARERLRTVLGPYLRGNQELNSSREIVTLREA
jgi:RNA polymerase sigma-70 factor (ECF subfamily)